MRRLAPPARATLVRATVAFALLSPFAQTGCGQLTDADPAATTAPGDDGSLRGELAAYTSDDPELGSDTRYFLRDADGTERRLLSDALVKAEDLQPGTLIRVWGRPTADAFHVTSVETAAAEVSRVSSALRNSVPLPARSFAFVLLDMGAGVNTTADAAMG